LGLVTLPGKSCPKNQALNGVNDGDDAVGVVVGLIAVGFDVTWSMVEGWSVGDGVVVLFSKED